MDKKIHVAIFEDNVALRDSICTYLRAKEKYIIVFDLPKLSDLSTEIIGYPIDIILLDIHLRDGSSLENIAQLKTQFPISKIVVLTGDENEEVLLKAIENGAMGYILKPFNISNLIDTIETVNDKGYFLSSELIQKLMKVLNKRKMNSTPDENELLTPREKRVISLLQEGYSYKEISLILDISYHTVNQHIKNAYKKMSINNKYDLLNYNKNNNP